MHLITILLPLLLAAPSEAGPLRRRALVPRQFVNGTTTGTGIQPATTTSSSTGTSTPLTSLPVTTSARPTTSSTPAKTTSAASSMSSSMKLGPLVPPAGTQTTTTQSTSSSSTTSASTTTASTTSVATTPSLLSSSLTRASTTSSLPSLSTSVSTSGSGSVSTVPTTAPTSRGLSPSTGFSTSTRATASTTSARGVPTTLVTSSSSSSQKPGTTPVPDDDDFDGTVTITVTRSKPTTTPVPTATTTPLAPGIPASSSSRGTTSTLSSASVASSSLFTSSTSTGRRGNTETPTGTPVSEVPTAIYSRPAPTVTVSPDVYSANKADARVLNELYSSLNLQSACSDAQIACISGNVMTCAGGGFDVITDCVAEATAGLQRSCFAMPMNSTRGVQVGCFNVDFARSVPDFDDQHEACRGHLDERLDEHSDEHFAEVLDAHPNQALEQRGWRRHHHTLPVHPELDWGAGSYHYAASPHVIDHVPDHVRQPAD
ncbi:hypothetical protein GGTG_05378 [Gaeumannomyces tritici R3-111a-1]|uniref:Uncharacterized protein n=1 Tax=Gaeumannomyces tritici (strain R3-111a-1) TaxID=644352 RepID=J3NVR5_GAET3|nr:hypothetical protein GGTG_05378 [Gaeumannomyces tritici R3-111a-1]EJT75444.1 hypothetical protein GGTG_05378 [Gaeumannomyces tritici R3-111a-1]